MRMVLTIIAGLLAAVVTLAAFAGLSWWVSTEGSTVGYIAAVLFGIMAVLGAALVYIYIVFEDKTPAAGSTGNKATSDDVLDPAAMAAAMLIGTSDQFHDANTAETDTEVDGGEYDDPGNLD